MGEVLSVQADEILRIWRLARHSMRPETLPGLSDGVLQSFFASLGGLLSSGAEPSRVVGHLRGTLRVPPGTGEIAVHDEWEDVRQVLRATCQSLGALPQVGDWLDEAARSAQAIAVQVARGERGVHAQVLRLVVFSGLALRAKTV
jgi:hypothetical protein